MSRSAFRPTLHTLDEDPTATTTTTTTTITTHHTDLDPYHVSTITHLQKVHAREIAALEKRISNIRAHHAFQLDQLQKEHDAEIDIIISEFSKLADQLWIEYRMMLPAEKTDSKRFEAVVWCAQAAGELVGGAMKVAEAVRVMRDVYGKKRKEMKILEEKNLRNGVLLEK